jgi:hypothetical protein
MSRTDNTFSGYRVHPSPEEFSPQHLPELLQCCVFPLMLPGEVTEQQLIR